MFACIIFLLDHRGQEDGFDNLRQVLGVHADVSMTTQGTLQLVSLVRQRSDKDHG